MKAKDKVLPPGQGKLVWIAAAFSLLLAVGAIVMSLDPMQAGPVKYSSNDAVAAVESGRVPVGSDPPTVEWSKGARAAEGMMTAAPSGGGRKSMVLRAPPRTEWTESATSAIATLLPLAESGQADAMTELAHRLMACRNSVGATEASTRRKVLQRFYGRNGHEPRSEVELTETAVEIENLTRLVELCRGIDPTLMDARISWLERAARAGDIGAMLDYAGYALHDLNSTDDILMNFEEVGRRRQLAGELLQGALGRGACVDALPRLAEAYSGERGRYDWLFKADPYLALVYAEAASQAGISQERLASARGKLPDPAHQAAAAEQGKALMVSKCAGSY